MKIAIAGYGYVGKAVHNSVKRWHQSMVIDPGYEEYENNKVDDTFDGLIICVSTPEADDGSCDMTNVIDVIQTTPKRVPILIKSTISIEGWLQINADFPNHYICFSPEFLRAETALEDFKNQDMMYISIEKSGSHKHWKDVFKGCLNNRNYDFKSAEELILAKYFRNSFLATKVSFFNQVYDLCKAKDIDFEAVRQVIGDDKRIGHGHSMVTDQRGFGGHCFPKDTNAIIETAKNDNVDLSLIEEAIKYNATIRKPNK